MYKVKIYINREKNSPLKKIQEKFIWNFAPLVCFIIANKNPNFLQYDNNNNTLFASYHSHDLASTKGTCLSIKY